MSFGDVKNESHNFRAMKTENKETKKVRKKGEAGERKKEGGKG